MGVVMVWLPVRHIPPFVLKCFVNGYKKSVFVLYLSLIQLHYVFTKPYLALQNIFSTVCQCPHFNVDETKWRSQTKFIFVFEKCKFSVKIFGRYEACETDPIFTEITLKPTWHTYSSFLNRLRYREAGLPEPLILFIQWLCSAIFMYISYSGAQPSQWFIGVWASGCESETSSDRDETDKNWAKMWYSCGFLELPGSPGLRRAVWAVGEEESNRKSPLETRTDWERSETWSQISLHHSFTLSWMTSLFMRMCHCDLNFQDFQVST